jgi:general secretion pathway protein K
MPTSPQSVHGHPHCTRISGLRTPFYGRSLRRPCRRGGALLAVLWLSAALSAIALSVASTVRTETDRTGTSSEGLRTYYLASGSIDRAILWIQWGIQNYVNPDNSPRYYRAPMPYLRFNYPSGVAIVEVIPESSKININYAPLPDIESLLVASGANPMEAAQIAAGILDWRSGAADPPGLGFRNPDQTFRPRHASFEEIEEILLVRGMTPDLFYGGYDRDSQGRLVPRGGLRDAITTFGSQGNQIDVNTASPLLLASLGIPPQSIDAILRQRMIQPFKNIDELGPLVGPAAGKLQVVTGTRMTWTLRATARIRLADGRLSDLSRTVSATIVFLPPQLAQTEPPYSVMRWSDQATPANLAALPF